MQSQTFVEDQELGVIFNPEQFVLTHAERGGNPVGKGREGPGNVKCVIFKLQQMQVLYK